jgi:hypothetical protein
VKLHEAGRGNYFLLPYALSAAPIKIKIKIKIKIEIKIKIKILGSECRTSGTYAKRAKQATKKDNRLCFLNYLAFFSRQPTGLFPYFPGL